MRKSLNSMKGSSINRL